ncbi:hypothetical protein CRG98_046403 [Punica granatum]|uniref:Uncharacterized protein n=1 Tax=Punica granatum TaxID=22663 RepID=A0A2I0HN90_PUNGR|nr:hypothetical protein CRG98_046403 [Punica granatum]
MQPKKNSSIIAWKPTKLQPEQDCDMGNRTTASRKHTGISTPRELQVRLTSALSAALILKSETNTATAAGDGVDYIELERERVHQCASRLTESGTTQRICPLPSVSHC